MRLPCRRLAAFELRELQNTPFVTVGCLSFEPRCLAVPAHLWKTYGAQANIFLLELRDPPDGIPDYGTERNQRVEQNRKALRGDGTKWTSIEGDLISSEDDLLNNLNSFLQKDAAS